MTTKNTYGFKADISAKNKREDILSFRGKEEAMKVWNYHTKMVQLKLVIMILIIMIL